jgi:acyl-coenzyme A thioesterase PaaI-like protein
MNAAEKAVLATRQVGMHLYGHLLGVWCEPPSSGRCFGELAVNSRCLDENGGVSIGALASLGDMALQTCLLSSYPGLRLVTLLLQVRLYGSNACSAVRIAAQASHVGKHAGLAHATLNDENGRPVGDVSGTFARIQPPNGWRPLPWEIGLDRPVYAGNLANCEFSDAETSQIKTLDALLKDGTARFPDLIKLGDTTHHDTLCKVAWQPEAHLLNRAGEVQGGALFGALALASKVAAVEGVNLIEHKVQFLRPAKGDAHIAVEALHSGRRFSSTFSRMADAEGRLVALGWSQFSNE